MSERLSERERIITELKNVIGCTCDPAYKIRGLSAPDCAYCNYVDEVADWHLAEVKLLVEALESLIDDEECSFDHHGYCQTHFSGSSPCVMDMARKTLKRANGGE